ncbi:MAG TPA: M14 metallopeptidase family protein [Bryobacteraceae bacterium]|nr:M14 metallopeptidase family protein [Bryobacteraceae bacterium]
MIFRTAVVLLCLVQFVRPAVPTPEEHLGYKPGADYKLADYSDIITYFQKLTASSDRVRLVEFGKSSHGKPAYVAFISSAENLRQLERYRDISRRLALALVEDEEAQRLASEGKAVVWIDSGLHATEVAPAQHAPELAYRMLTNEDAETRRIRENVILMQVPVINPDGLDMVVKWYRNNVGTPHELAPLPWLYQKYSGHDNNRDWFMLNLQETRNVTRLLFQEWFPQIVYNQHQQPAFPARIFVPPYAEPLNPNIPATVMEGINAIGAAISERFARENKPGVLSYFGYDGWWNGGLRSVPAFHNMHGILTETAAHSYATPREYDVKELPERFGNGMPTKHPTIFYQRPWMGGKWTVRDAIEYMLTADWAILHHAAARHSEFLLKSYQMARAQIEAGTRGKPFAYVIPEEQWDRSSALEMMKRLAAGGIVVQRAKAPFQAGGKTFSDGAYVLQAAQPFRPYLVDLMEPQRYPEIRTGSDGPTKRPYDIAGWTLPMQMGVQVQRIEEPFQAQLVPVETVPELAPSLDQRENSSFLAIAGLLNRKTKVRRAADGAILVEGQSPAGSFSKASWELRKPRLALYEPWTANMDTGWTQWVLDTYQIEHTLLHNEDIRKGGLNAKFDTILFASQSAASILHGTREGEKIASPQPSLGEAAQGISQQRHEYAGGIGISGLYQLDSFVRNGGTLIALDAAAELPAHYFPLPVRSATAGPRGSDGYYCPGSLLRITVDNTNPIAFGMPEGAIAFSSGGHAWDITLLPEYNRDGRRVRSVARYAKSSLLASGWLSGEKVVLGKEILVEARHGNGKVVLFGFRPQFRGQPFGTFKFLLNAIYLGSAQKLD